MPYDILVLELKQRRRPSGLRRLCLWRGRPRSLALLGMTTKNREGVLFRRGLLAAPFLFMDKNKNNSGAEREKEVIELQAVADENPKRKGEIIEAAFLAKVCKLRIPVCKPWGDSERYDFVVDWGKGFWSVQVKAGTSHKRSGYKVGSSRDGRVFTKDDMDFVVVYIVQEDLWYVVPVEIAEGASSLWFTPRFARSRFAKYREAWCLLDCGLEERGRDDIPVRCRSEALSVRCAVCPLQHKVESPARIRPRRLK
jgi:hypothetical protein